MQNGMSVRALLLNSTYEPMKVVNWQKALILWFQDKVEIVEFHSVYVRSARMQFRIPSVIRLKSYVRLKGIERVRFCRENVYLRDDYTCQYCGHRYHIKELTLDHVVPASKAGLKNWTNVVSACRPCNQRKSNRTPKAAGMPLLKEPKAPAWLPSPDLDPLRNTFPSNWMTYFTYKIAGSG